MHNQQLVHQEQKEIRDDLNHLASHTGKFIEKFRHFIDKCVPIQQLLLFDLDKR